MILLYNTILTIYYLLIQLFSIKNRKAKLWIEGRRDIFGIIDRIIDKNIQYNWFHFASLGEFEQGRPVLEKFKSHFPEEHVIVTFFSPSGYEIRKNYALADHVFYLPLDTKANAIRFISLIKPKFAVFTKYEYWYHYFKELNDQQIPLYLISGIFRENQPFFKWYGTLHREMLNFIDHLFVQNKESADLLKNIHVDNVSISGDTRFDRVYENAQSPKQLPEIGKFCEGHKIFIAGSTWPKDEELLATLIKTMPEWKFILAPHEINENHISHLKTLLNNDYVIYSQCKNQVPLFHEKVLIIDNIGMLSSLYQYADIAYIGGGFGAGIHNTLEAAAFGLPVIFGPNYQKFQEAKDLLNIGAGFTVNNYTELQSSVQSFMQDELRFSAGSKARVYVKNRTGASDMILKYISSAIGVK